MYFLPRTWWSILSLHPQTMVQRYPYRYSFRLYISKRILIISFVAEDNVQCEPFKFHPHFDVFVFGFPSSFRPIVLPRFANFSSLTHHVFTFIVADNLSRNSHKLAKFWTLRPHLNICGWPPTRVCPCIMHYRCIETLFNVLNITHANLLVTMASLTPSVSYAPRWVVVYRCNA